MNSVLFFILSFIVSGILQASVTILPPQASAGSEIGRAFGEGLVQGMQRGADTAFQQQTKKPQSQQEISKLLRLLQSQKEEVEKEWIKDFINDAAKLNIVERINKISPITNASSFAGEHPALQCVVAHLILYGNIYPELSELLSKCLPKKRIGNTENFALELLFEAANEKKYTQAKKLLASYYLDKKSYPQVLHWLHSAAEDGANDAMRALISYYIQGIGVPRDLAESIKWAALAEAKGDKQSSQIMQFMIKDNQISQLDEFKEGLKRAQDWKQRHLSLFIHP